MAGQYENVTNTELAILEVLWTGGPATIRQITDRLYPHGKPSHYATVQSLLVRLESKGCVARDRSGFAHVFRATVERAGLIGRRLKDLADRLCEGSMTPLLLHLAQGARLTPSERQMLRRLIDQSGD
jgi:predicted transcriptional regulator